MTVRVRFAPSPTGHLHVGNVRTALYSWLYARQKGGAFVLRIEDTDLARSERRFEDQLIEDLKWLGLTWDEGVDIGGSHGPYRQTDRFDIYRDYAERLLHEGRAYYCFCPPELLEEERQRQLAAGEQPAYSGRCRAIPPEEAKSRVANGEEAVLRLKVREGTIGFEDIVFGPIEVDCSIIGDFVLLRSDGSAQYNHACVVDDALMEISPVIRGEGHISNTHRQLLIYEALGLQPPAFAHLSTLVGSDGSKLSKRHGATSIDEFRLQGYLPEALNNYLALLGWTPQDESREILNLDQLVAEFDLSRVHRSPATFDLEKLNWVNRSHLKNADRSRLAQLVLPYLQEQGRIPKHPERQVLEWLREIVEAIAHHLTKIEDIGSETDVIFRFEPEKDLLRPEAQETLADPEAARVIEAFSKRIQAYELLSLENYKQSLKEVKEATGRKGKDLFHPIRVALTARTSGPELDKLVPIFEKGKELDLPTRIAGVKERVSAVMARLPERKM
ncbi:MAG: glutamate--tRNA ligase [Acidobacteriota bacterium]